MDINIRFFGSESRENRYILCFFYAIFDNIFKLIKIYFIYIVEYLMNKLRKTIIGLACATPFVIPVVYK